MKKIISLSALLLAAVTMHAQLSWLQMADFGGTPCRGQASCSINGMGYMGLGLLTGGSGSTQWYAYNPATNAWTQKASFPSSGRYGCAEFVIGGVYYLVTGSNGNSLSETWKYDEGTNTWSQGAAYAGGVRQSAVGFSIGNKGYVGTGYHAGASYSDFYEYDPVADSWTRKADFPGMARNGATGFSIGNKGYIGMGNNTNSTNNFRDFYEYDPSTDQWAQKADFPIPYVVRPCAYSSASSGFVLCGYYYQSVGITHNPLNMFYKYNQATDVWTLDGTFPGLPRGYAGGFAINNDIYIACGGPNNGLSPMYGDLWKLSNGLTLRVDNSLNETDFSMWPNPAVNEIHFGTEVAGKKLLMARIFDVSGKQIRTVHLQDANNTVNISDLSSGLYFVELITRNGEVLDSRFVKQ